MVGNDHSCHGIQQVLTVSAPTPDHSLPYALGVPTGTYHTHCDIRQMLIVLVARSDQCIPDNAALLTKLYMYRFP